MLRALGFQRQMVSWIFLIESSFVALLGIGWGRPGVDPAAQMITEMAAEIRALLSRCRGRRSFSCWSGVLHDPADHLAAAVQASQ